jgi:hypothetical protein
VNPNIAELARLSSYPLTRRWQYDWHDFETELGFTFPSEYKEYVSYFPPGLHGGVFTAEHPANREGAMSFVEHFKLGAEVYAVALQGAHGAMPIYPAAGGLVPWIQYESTAALAWLPEGDDPDQWPLYAVSDENRYERLPGSTVEALIAVLRGEAGRSALPGTFYESLEFFGNPFSFQTHKDPTPDVELPEPELLDTPADSE